MAIKISELFESLQCEGRFVGVPSIFLRTFGCNFTCSGFSMPRGEKSLERFDIKPELFKKYQDLPLVHTGCDSYASWDPRFKDFCPTLEISEIVDKMVQLLPKGTFGQDQHLILTGGEPLLGWQKQFPALFQEIFNRNLGLTNLTFETNGTQKLSGELRTSLSHWYNKNFLQTTFSVSAKLPCSGEPWEKAILPETVMDYLTVPGSDLYLKFVVGTDEDLQDVHKAVQEYRDAGFKGSVYLMPVGGTVESYAKTNTEVADLAIKYGYRYSPRLQVSLYKNSWGK